MSASGRLWVSLDSFIIWLLSIKKRRQTTESTSKKNTPGRQADMNESNSWEEDGLTLLYLGNIGFSLWRVVELNIVKRFKDKFQAPIMDLGCGDGAFFQLAIGSGEIGMDIFDGLEDVVRPGIYKRVIQGDITKNTGIPSGSLNTVFTNSVMEHIDDLDAALREISRILAPGGRFIATVPMREFLDGLATWSSKADSELLHQRLTHANLLTDEQWASKLADAGIEFETVEHYLSPAAGQLVRIVNGAFWGNVERRARSLTWKLMRRKVVKLVKESMDCPDGYCGLVIGRKI